jgi:hypothetical protein
MELAVKPAPAPDSWSEAWTWEPSLATPDPDAIARKAAPPPEDPKLVDIFTRHQAWTDTLIGQFELALKPMVDAATEKTLAKLKAALSLTDGAIDPTAANDKILANADGAFMAELNAEGYPKLLADYVGNFSDQLPYLQEMLVELGARSASDPIAFSPQDLKILGRIEATTVGKLERLFAGAATNAVDRVLFSVSGLPFEQLVTTIAESMGKTLASARTWADTSVSAWYRTAASLQYDEIQADTPGDEALKFRYSGPDDIKTRPFCEALLNAGKSYTRDQIGAMSNGQIPNVFVSCGGFNCRHLFVLSLK